MPALCLRPAALPAARTHQCEDAGIGASGTVETPAIATSDSEPTRPLPSSPACSTYWAIQGWIQGGASAAGQRAGF